MLILKRTQGGRIPPASPSGHVEFEQVSKIAQLLLADGEKKMNQESDMNNSEPLFVVSVGSTLGEQVSNLETCEEPLSPLHSKDDNLLSVVVNTQVMQDCKGSTSSKSPMQCRNESLVSAGSKGAATSPPQLVPKSDSSTSNHSACDPCAKDESGDAIAKSKIISDHLAELPSGTDPESRRQRRLIRNRLSAALHRQRKRETLDTQKQIIESKDATIAKLKSQTLDLQARNKSLESVLGVLLNYYGKDEINRVLKMSSNSVAPAASLNQLLNSIVPDCESSSVSSFSEENAVTPATSPEGSPLHSFSDDSVGGPTDRSTLRPKKRQRNGLLPFVSSLAACALLGCTILPPSTFQIFFGQTNVPKIPEMQVHRRLEEEDPSPVYSIDKWSNIEVQRLLTGKAKKKQEVQQSWVISPIESYPHLWSFDEGTPWSVQRATQLFDFRSSSHASGKSVAAVPFALSRPFRREIMSVTNLPKSKTVHGHIHTETPIRFLRGAIPPHMMQYDGETYDSKEVLQDFPDKNDKALVHIESRGSIGASYMFCPSAYASLSPGFIDLAGLSQESSKNRNVDMSGQTEFESSKLGWASKSAFIASSLNEEVDYSEYAHDTGSGEDTIDSLLDESHGLLYEKNTAYPEVFNEESKALVPTVFNKKLGVDIFSYSNVAGDSIGRSITVVQGDDPFMSILFPASAIHGGSPSADEQKSQPWIEIGCQVLSARIVNGVNFVGDHLHREN